MGVGIIPELDDVWMAVENGLDDPPLNALAAAVHQSDHRKAGLDRGVDVILDDRRDVAWRKRVQIEFGLNRYADWSGRCCHRSLSPSPCKLLSPLS